MSQDEEHALARAVKDAAEALNTAATAAAAKGLKTELRLLAYGGTCRSSSSPEHFVSVKVTKEL
jgi:alkyl hydroperoxide reductase subunit AhpF